tara:strand:+ start:4445 stop:4777 length:333 start_codon:yes stop_codon:yes gene_type:complete
MLGTEKTFKTNNEELVMENNQDTETEFQIDSGIPLPEDTRSGECKYPFGKMNEGDSFFIPLRQGDQIDRMKNRLSQSTRTYGKKQTPEQHFRIRLRLENEISGVRVWRKD